MGLISKLFGGDKPQKQDYAPTEAEKAGAESAVRDYNRLATTFYPLQERMVEESRQDFSKLYAGRANADTAIANRDAVDASIVGDVSQGSVSRLADVGRATSAAYGENQTSAKERSLTMQDGRKLGIAGVGHGLAATTAGGMRAASSNAVSKALTAIRARQKINSARSAAIGQVGGSALTMAALSSPSASTPMTSTSQSQIVSPNAGVDMYANSNRYAGHA